MPYLCYNVVNVEIYKITNAIVYYYFISMHNRSNTLLIMLTMHELPL